MILFAVAFWALGSPQAAPDLGHIAHHTLEICRQDQVREAAAAPTAYPEARDAELVIVRISSDRCYISADGWAGDNGAILHHVTAAASLETDGEWEATETRLEQVNERGPALWSRFTRFDETGTETGWITLVEPVSGRSGPFELTYAVAPQ